MKVEFQSMISTLPLREGGGGGGRGNFALGPQLKSSPQSNEGP